MFLCRDKLTYSSEYCLNESHTCFVNITKDTNVVVSIISLVGSLFVYNPVRLICCMKFSIKPLVEGSCISVKRTCGFV